MNHYGNVWIASVYFLYAAQYQAEHMEDMGPVYESHLTLIYIQPSNLQYTSSALRVHCKLYKRVSTMNWISILNTTMNQGKYVCRPKTHVCLGHIMEINQLYVCLTISVYNHIRNLIVYVKLLVVNSNM